ncbi:MAG: ABC transporter permease, partial [Candidatus Muirbacterium halophilum]|nr:ABC transporter permease [Candidatus Muirbacterium halophilum]
YSNSILTGVLEEKTSKVLEVLLSSCTSFQLMMGKLFGVGSVGLFQFTIWTILGGGSFLYLKSAFPEFKGLINLEISIFLYFILFFVTGFFQYATLFLAAGSLCSNQEDARQLATPVTFLIVAVFILSFNAMNNPGSDSVRIMSFIPFFTPMMMFVRITVASPELWEIILSLVINIVAIFFFIYITSKIYRVGILMYGKRPTFKEVINWMKYS